MTIRDEQDVIREGRVDYHPAFFDVGDEPE